MKQGCQVSFISSYQLTCCLTLFKTWCFLSVFDAPIIICNQETPSHSQAHGVISFVLLLFLNLLPLIILTHLLVSQSHVIKEITIKILVEKCENLSALIRPIYSAVMVLWSWGHLQLFPWARFNSPSWWITAMHQGACAKWKCNSRGRLKEIKDEWLRMNSGWNMITGC